MRIILLLILALVLLGACTTTEKAASTQDNICNSTTCSSTYNLANRTVEKVEVYHFHGHSQCSACIAVGKLAEETVNTYFAQELKSGKVVFGHINAQLAENTELAAKYKVTGSSLWIGVYDNNGFHPEQNTNVWYKINDKADYMNYLKGIIEKRLAGDLS
jgi:hypothetical protein